MHAQAAQDMFVKTFQSTQAFDVSKSFLTWIFRILINTCIDYRRRREVVTEAIDITPLSSSSQISWF
jgi:DNA-directed RNA polymerase specialized sigma24 family protein